MTGQMRPTFPALLDGYQRDSDAVRLTAADVAYGPHPRQVFDLVAGTAPWRGTLAYFHAGFWQSRDKSLFRFIAPVLARRGIDVALVNYPLCPDVTLPQLVAATRAAVPAVLARSAAAGRGGASLSATGHSAGGHIVVELALSEWQAASPICGVAALSGVYDLEPLLETALNDKLRLTRPVAHAMSPVRRVRPGMPPALFVAGGAETPAFQEPRRNRVAVSPGFDVPEMPVALRGRGLGRVAWHRRGARRHDDRRFWMALGNTGADAALIASAVRNERRHRACDPIEQGADLGAIIGFLACEGGGDHPAAAGIQADMQDRRVLVPCFSWPLARIAQVQSRTVHRKRGGCQDGKR